MSQIYNFGNMTISDFGKELSSHSPAPGGGAVASICGMLAASLGGMVSSLTIASKKYEQSKEEMTALKKELSGIADNLMLLASKDADAFSSLMDAYKLPKSTDAEKLIRKQAIDQGIALASLVPLEIAQTISKIFNPLETLAIKGNTSACTDTIIAIILARTAIRAALYNVKINFPFVNDEALASDLKLKVIALEEDAMEKEKRLLALFPNIEI